MRPTATTRIRRRTRRRRPGTWGNAGRNSITGPRSSVERRHHADVPVGQPFNLDWRIDATNVLNRVTYTSVNTMSAARSSGCRTRRTRCGSFRPAAAEILRRQCAALRPSLSSWSFIAVCLGRSGAAAAAAADRRPTFRTSTRLIVADRHRQGQGRQADRRADRQRLRGHRGRRAAGDRLRRVPAAGRDVPPAHGRRPQAPVPLAADPPHRATPVAPATQAQIAVAATGRHPLPRPPAAGALLRRRRWCRRRSDPRLHRTRSNSSTRR